MSIRWTLNPTAFQDTSSPNVEASIPSAPHSCLASEPACRARATGGRNSDFALPPRSEFRLRSPTEVGIPTSLFCPKNPSPGQRRRSGRGLLLARSLPESPRRQSCREHRIAPSILSLAQDCSTQSCAEHRIAPLNPASQDCSTHSCADSRIAPMQHKQLGLGTVLARAQARDGVGPAVEFPGLWHVVDAQDEGQTAREERVSELRVEGQVMPPPPRAIVVHGATGEDVGRVGIDALPGRQAGRSRLSVGAADAARCSVPVAAAARRSPTFPRSCCAAGRMSRQPDARHGLSERPAGGARSRSVCPPCAPPGAARSAGRPGLASSNSGAGLRRARRRRRRAPPGPDAGRQGSTPAFRNRRRESEAQ